MNKYLFYISEFIKPPYDKKKFNKYLTLFQRLFFKNSYVFGYPFKLTIDVCNHCNLKCPLCPTGRGEKGRFQGMMPFENFKKIMDELSSYLYYIDLFQWGEPLLHKDIFKMIRYAQDRGVRVNLSTNFNFSGISQDLINSKLDTLIISLDGASNKTVSKYQVGSIYENVMNNIRDLVDKKKELNSTSPFIRWRFLVMKHNEHEVPKAKKIADELGIKLELGTFFWDTDKHVFKTNEQQFAAAEHWLPSDEEYSLFDHEKKQRKTQLKDDCSWLWHHAVVNVDGSVSPCYLIYEEKYDFGNMFKEGSFKKVWNSPRYRSARKSIARDKSFVPTVCDICKRNEAMF